MVTPARGDVWWADLNPVRGREQAGRRPVLIVTANTFNYGPRGLVWLLPMTRTRRPYPFHVEVSAAESGLSYASYVMCEQLRSIALERLLDTAPAGRITRATLARIERLLHILLDLP